MAIIIGIDPGYDGAIAVLIGDELVVYPMPTIKLKGKGRNKRQIDEPMLRSYLSWDGVNLVVIEHVHAFPKQGVVATFNFGVGWGLVRGICVGLDMPYQLVRPQDWQKIMLLGQPKGSEMLVASRLWPKFDWHERKPIKKQLEGMADAALIAEYGRRLSCGI